MQDGVDVKVPLELIEEALHIQQRDFSDSLDKVDRYLCGQFDDPYSMKDLTGEQKDMLKRSRQNWVTIPVNASTQALAVDGLRLGEDRDSSVELVDMPEWQMWQRSNLDAKQHVVHYGAVGYGQAFVLSETGPDGRAVARPLSSLNTAMVFEDPISDDNALIAVTQVSEPRQFDSGGKTHVVRGVAYAWDRFNRYKISFVDGQLDVAFDGAHGGNGECPVTRFYPQMDTEGRVLGAVAPIIPWQDAFNQMLFNLFVAQSHGAHRILWATGMTPPRMVGDDGAPLLDDNGRPRHVPIKAGAGDFLVNSDPQAKFGALPASDLGGYISSLDMMVKDFLALTQTPPDFLLGQMANLSAEALASAERSFRRKIAGYQRSFGEAWERVLRVGMVIEGRDPRDAWEHNEVLWRDFEQHRLSSTADALVKLREIGVPAPALWEFVPGISPRQLDQWRVYAAEADSFDKFGRQLDEYSSLPSLPSEGVGDG